MSQRAKAILGNMNNAPMIFRLLSMLATDVPRKEIAKRLGVTEYMVKTLIEALTK